MFFNLFKRRETSVFLPWESWMIHLVTIGCFLILVLSAVYYFYRLSPSIIAFVACVAFVVGWAFSPGFKNEKHHEKKELFHPRTFLWIFGSVTSSIMVLSLLWSARTEDALASPWQAVPALIFLLYVLSAFFTVRVARTADLKWSLPTMLLFSLGTFSVSMIIYRLGFGYDPFVHQATERVILEKGFILPKQPMYIGQYVSVVSLAWLSHFSISRIDRALVPLVSVFVMIPMLVTAFRYGWMKQIGKPVLAVVGLCMIPIGYFAFTVPFNFALISLVLIVAFFPLADQVRIKWLIASLGCVALAIHPLIGLPTALIALTAVFRKVPVWSLIVSIPVMLFIAFTVYLRTQGASMDIPSGSFVIEVLKALFGNPYELGRGKPYLAILYALLYLAPLLLIGVSIYGYAEQLLKDPLHRRSVWALAYATIGILIGAVIIPMFFVFPNIIASEQYEFSLRLLLILPLLWLPGIAYAVYAGLHQKSHIRNACFSIAIALILLGSWTASYPQFNDISYMPAPGLSRGDLDAVQFIEGNSNGIPYTALTSQMMSAGALTEFGFEKQIPTRGGRLYAYAIPTGGVLYQYYLRFISGEEDPEKLLAEFNQFTDTPLVYIAVPDSWDPQNMISKYLEPILLSNYEFGNNRIYKLKAMARPL